ncbi:hypothetical protein RhiirA1_495999 [Rhizophagus irregularis]|uniref:SWIM-type domain-containing protein n=1 Tax=Rhizophagus irregularis TaxID=588596 RepID=A0A2N0R4R6_9GLOM|nr:hypothetical protein RhiirA1_495999 [Rhizophagus irregularis]
MDIKSQNSPQNFEISQFELDAFVDIDDKEKAREWFLSFESKSKMTMPESRRYKIKGKKDGHSPASAMYDYEDALYLSAMDEQELLVLLADRMTNPNYDYIAKLFYKYREMALGDHNGTSMFKRLEEVVNDYNNSGHGKTILQEYDSCTGKAFILCVVINLMNQVHERVLQSGELCYIDASASFEPLNTSITLLYISCMVGALPLGLFITSDESEITLEKALNLLKTILPQHAFFGCESQVGPKVFLTDDSSAERNALELCWPEGIRLLCTFHILQAFWRWLYDLKHHINKEDWGPIIKKMKEILYTTSGSEMHTHYCEFKQMFYGSKIGTCTCPIGMTGVPCKHQGAVSVKFHISTFNFLPSLASNDRMIYAYIALGYVAKDNSFYASLHAVTTPQDLQTKVGTSNNNTTIEYGVLSCKESNENVEIVDISAFTDFLEEVRRDYRDGGAQLRTALDKFAEHYKAAKLKSIPQLTSFLYDLNRDLDPMVNLRSGSMIRVQVESVKRRKTEGSGYKCKLPNVIKDKENLDPQNIPSCKTRKASKKEHNLSKNVLKNQPN